MTVVEKSLFIAFLLQVASVVMLLTNGGTLTEILAFKTPIIVSYITIFLGVIVLLFDCFLIFIFTGKAIEYLKRR